MRGMLVVYLVARDARRLAPKCSLVSGLGVTHVQIRLFETNRNPLLTLQWLVFI